MSGELFHVIAQVIRRHTTEHGTVPSCVGYDLAERTWSDPMPFCSKTSSTAAAAL